MFDWLFEGRTVVYMALGGIAANVRLELRRTFEHDVPAADGTATSEKLRAAIATIGGNLRPALQNAVLVLGKALGTRLDEHGVFDDVAARRSLSTRLRRDVWMFAQIVRGTMRHRARGAGSGGYTLTTDVEPPEVRVTVDAVGPPGGRPGGSGASESAARPRSNRSDGASRRGATGESGEPADRGEGGWGTGRRGEGAGRSGRRRIGGKWPGSRRAEGGRSAWEGGLVSGVAMR